jgi:hypothetical protein
MGDVMSTNSSSEEYIPAIEEVSIENFKGIKHCEIKDIGRINLFIGRNSCGKSSVMEAMYFTGKEFIGSYLPQCIQRRANRGQWSARELWYEYNTGSNLGVKLGFNDKDFVSMKFKFSPEERVVNVILSSGSPSTSSADEIHSRYRLSGFDYSGGRPTRISSPHSEEIRRYFADSVFLDPTIKGDVRHIEGNYLNVLKLSEESSSDLARRTAQIYETEPSWEFLPHQDFSPDTLVDLLS